jgi:energy-coupling factor transporter transmembrane protein EcfT
MILFNYINHTSILHRLSPLTKLLAMILLGSMTISLQDLSKNYISFIFFYALVFSLIIIARIKITLLLKELPYFIIIIPLIIFFSSFSITRNQAYYLNHLDISALLTSLTFILKLILFTLLSIIFMATTRIKEINIALEVIFRRIPLVNSTRLATMISLVLAQIPIIFDLYGQIKQAQKARCIDNSKNPFRKISFLASSLIYRVLQNADAIALNYQSKGYNDERTQYKCKLSIKEIIGLIIMVVIALFVIGI